MIECFDLMWSDEPKTSHVTEELPSERQKVLKTEKTKKLAIKFMAGSTGRLHKAFQHSTPSLQKI